MAAEPGSGMGDDHPFGNVAEANDNYIRMRNVAVTLKQLEEQTIADAELYPAELAKVMRIPVHAIGGMFKEETMRTAVHVEEEERRG